MKKKIKVIGGLICAAAILASAPFVIYLKALPAAVSNPNVIKFVKNSAHKYAGVDLEIKNPVLKTSLSPQISFKTDEIQISKDDLKMFSAQNLDTEISALTTEYDTVKSVISKNIEKTFKRYNA